jgi:hypothetical protein
LYRISAILGWSHTFASCSYLFNLIFSLLILSMTRNCNKSRAATQSAAPTAGPPTLSFAVADLVTPAESVSAPIESYVDRVLMTRCGIVQEAISLDPPSPLKRRRVEKATPTVQNDLTISAPSNGNDMDTDRYAMDQEDYSNDPPLAPLPHLLNPKYFEPSVRAMA